MIEEGTMKFLKAASANNFLPESHANLQYTVARYNGTHLYVESLPPYNLNTV